MTARWAIAGPVPIPPGVAFVVTRSQWQADTLGPAMISSALRFFGQQHPAAVLLRDGNRWTFTSLDPSLPDEATALALVDGLAAAVAEADGDGT